MNGKNARDVMGVYSANDKISDERYPASFVLASSGIQIQGDRRRRFSKLTQGGYMFYTILLHR